MPCRVFCCSFFIFVLHLQPGFYLVYFQSVFGFVPPSFAFQIQPTTLLILLHHRGEKKLIKGLLIGEEKAELGQWRKVPEGRTNRTDNGAEEKNTFIYMSVFPNGHLSKLNEYIYLYIG